MECKFHSLKTNREAVPGPTSYRNHMHWVSHLKPRSPTPSAGVTGAMCCCTKFVPGSLQGGANVGDVFQVKTVMHSKT